MAEASCAGIEILHLGGRVKRGEAAKRPRDEQRPQCLLEHCRARHCVCSEGAARRDDELAARPSDGVCRISVRHHPKAMVMNNVGAAALSLLAKPVLELWRNAQ